MRRLGGFVLGKQGKNWSKQKTVVAYEGIGDV